MTVRPIRFCARSVSRPRCFPPDHFSSARNDSIEHQDMDQAALKVICEPVDEMIRQLKSCVRDLICIIDRDLDGAGRLLP